MDDTSCKTYFVFRVPKDFSGPGEGSTLIPGKS